MCQMADRQRSAVISWLQKFAANDWQDFLLILFCDRAAREAVMIRYGLGFAADPARACCTTLRTASTTTSGRSI